MLVTACTPGGVPHHYTQANWAFSPPLRKFVDSLGGLGAGNANNLGQFLPQWMTTRRNRARRRHGLGQVPPGRAQHPRAELGDVVQQAATSGGNVFAELMNTVKVCSLGQISRALYEVGGQYRRSM